ncbi:carbohydrate ABC transporter membrane protein 2, CUT1 family [Pseudonocardia thermophila]|uniref:Carbohydrate ABC transporter membrane protein 2, CUT1 family n=1 Tax=Pseudonocardia thermophila TaxID=1848 RepID=A0A1M6WPL1_PSETH|nr:carbohydrate ABC transporter permease [Pseudonocardia thermophila]SHK95703.1 carbohydrate ABC transporter membrane protein 2, CUT1 family [Pseudonocardia thermophila]
MTATHDRPRTTIPASSNTPAIRRRPRRRVKRGLVLGVVGLAYLLWILLPMWYVAISSVTTAEQIGVRPMPIIPTDITLDNYVGLLTGNTGREQFGTIDIGTRLIDAIAQSFLVSSILVVLNLLIAGLCAYGMSRYPFRGSRPLHLGVIAARVVPPIAIVGPFFVVFRYADLLDTPWALVISYNVFTLPIAIMVLKDYFDKLPVEIEEAARLDGASRLQIIWVVVAPLARPGLVAAGVLIFLEAWSEFFYSLVLTNQLTVPPLLAGFQSAQQFNWNSLAAATILALIPPVVIVLIFQRQVVGALAAGYDK